MKMRWVCLMMVLGCSTLKAEEPQKAVVKKLAQEMGEATVAGNIAKVIDYIHPAVVKALGGRAKAIERSESAIEDMKTRGITVRTSSAGTPEDFVKAGNEIFVIIPTVVDMEFPKGILRNKSYLLGISSDQGKTWTFVDGYGLRNAEQRKKLLPNLPDTLTLPEMMKPEIIPNAK